MLQNPAARTALGRRAATVPPSARPRLPAARHLQVAREHGGRRLALLVRGDPRVRCEHRVLPARRWTQSRHGRARRPEREQARGE